VNKLKEKKANVPNKEIYIEIIEAVVESRRIASFGVAVINKEAPPCEVI
jgi:hypothetical protein